MKKVLATLLITLMTGCAYNPAPPTVSSSDSIVDIAQQFYQSSEAGWISLSRAGADIQEDEHARFFREGYCLRDGFQTDDFNRMARQKCQQVGGTMAGSWCANGETDQPLFFARAGSPRATGTEAGCAGHFPEVGIFAMEPRFEGDSKWQELAEIHDYKSPSDVVQEELRNQEEQAKLRAMAQQIREDEARQRQREADIMLSRVGTSICQVDEDQNVRYMGQVDDMRDGMIHVHVLQAYSLTMNAHYRGFDPVYIWADPHTWKLC